MSNSESTGHTKVSVILIAPDNERRGAIARLIPGTQARIVREFSDYPAGEVLAKLAGTDCEVIMVDLDGGVEQAIALIGSICTRNVTLTVMACSSRHEADVVIRSMRAGAREFLTEPLASKAVEEALIRVTSRRQTVPIGRAPGKLLMFQGSKGGAGSTTLAINFAVAITKEKAGNVALVDLHPQLGEVALGLGLTPRFSVSDALENSGRLDGDFLSTLLTRHDSGLMVLASSDEYGTHRSLERGAEKLFTTIREEFAFVVVDAGSCSANVPNALLEMADAIYVITEANLPALRNARRLIGHFARKESTRGLQVVLNRFNARRVEIDEESVAKALSRPVDWKIPNDFAVVKSAQNLGMALVEQDSPVSRAVRQMAKSACREPAAGREPVAAIKGDQWKFWTSKSTRAQSTVCS